MATRGGQYRHLIIIQERTDTTDGLGQAIPTWSTFSKAWAAVEPLNGREYFTSSQYDSEVTVRIRLRYMDGITTKMRVSWNDKIYNIQSVIDPAERTKILQLMCSEGLNDG